MTYNAAPINLAEFDIEYIEGVTTNLHINPNCGAVFLQQHLPRLLQTLRFVEQALKQKTHAMLEEQLLQYEKLQRRTQIGTPSMEDLEHLKTTIKRDYPILFNEVKHMVKYAHQLKLLLEQLEQMHPGCTSQGKVWIHAFLQQLSQMYNQLVKRMILVVKQPEEIIKKLNQFDTQFLLLIDVGPVTPSVRVRIISAADAEQLKSGAAMCSQIPPAATTLNNQATFTNKNGTLESYFAAKPKLKDIFSRTHAKGGTKMAVTEQKYVVIYEIASNPSLQETLGYTETIWALSLPIVLIVHANQLNDAYATIIWDRMFYNESEADWAEFSWLLKVIFKHITGATVRTVSDEDIEYFRRKLNVRTNERLTFQRFAKDRITSEFTFWTWFISIAQLIKDKLLPYWEKGYILGFKSKEAVTEIMSTMNQAAFVLRFSDSQLGTVSVSTFRHDNTGMMQHTPYLLPVEKMGNTEPLVSLLRDFDRIQHIRYICNMFFVPTDKAIVFADPELNPKPTAEAPMGYHKLKMVIKSETSDDEHGQERSDSTSSSMSGMPFATRESSVRSHSVNDATPSPYNYSPFAHGSSCDYPDSSASSAYVTDANAWQQNASWGTPKSDASLSSEFSHANGYTASQWGPPSSLGHVPNQSHYELNANLPPTVFSAMAGSDRDENSILDQYL